MAKRKYTDKQLAENLRAREQSRSGDMLSYAATIGRSFEIQINLLAALIRDKHDPSLGRYKENLLINGIRAFLPKRFEIANGFVLFPEPGIHRGSQGNDKLVAENHTLSKQLDIIVFDSLEYPVVFRDGDFAIVRPESVRAIIEVKGVLDRGEVDSAVKLFADLGRKLRRYYDEAVAIDAAVPHKPSLLLMAWTVKYDSEGRPVIDGTRLRKRIVRQYKKEMTEEEAARIPLLESAMLYNDCEVSLDDKRIDINPGKPESLGLLNVGYETLPGYFVRSTSQDDFVREGDSTIASLISRIQYRLGLKPNPLFLAFERADPRADKPHDHQGFDLWFQSEVMLHPEEMHFWHRKPLDPR